MNKDEYKKNEQPLLKVRCLNKIYGTGCEQCLELTGPEKESNICSRCNSIVACSDINLDVYSGEIIGIVGESGSEKSTLIKLLYFDEIPTSGEVYLQSFEDGKTNLLTVSNQKKKMVAQSSIGYCLPKSLPGI